MAKFLLLVEMALKHCPQQMLKVFHGFLHIWVQRSSTICVTVQALLGIVTQPFVLVLDLLEEVEGRVAGIIVWEESDRRWSWPRDDRCQEDGIVGSACVFEIRTYHRPWPILYQLPAGRRHCSLYASRTCSQMYDRCIEGSLDRISRGILAMRKGTVSCARLVGRKYDDDGTPTGADTRTTSPYIFRHFRLNYLNLDVDININDRLAR